MSEVADAYQAGIEDAVYAALSEQFPTEAHKTLERAGGQTYVPWNLVAERLNLVLGVENWSFRVIREGFTQDECWVLGELAATIRGAVAVRQQYGVSPLVMGQKQTPVDDLLKKAGTDAFKKCAQVLGVALYLTDADDRAEVQAAMRGAGKPKPAPRRVTVHEPTASTGMQVNADGVPVCAIDRDGTMCGEPVKGWDARDGNPARDAFWVAEWQTKRDEYGMPLCIGHQIAVKKGTIPAVRWVPRSLEDARAASMVPFDRETAQSEYVNLALEAVEAGHRNADKLRSTDPASLSDDDLIATSKGLRAFLAKRRALAS